MTKTQIDKAQNIVWDAWDAESNEESVALVQKALAVDPFCADAYNCLAFCSETLLKRFEYYIRSIDCFKFRHEHSTEEHGDEGSPLDDTYFAQLKGAFWGHLETRPFMRAMEGYGKLLWEFNDKEGAIIAYNTMLELNPSDNQGVRFPLMAWLIINGDFEKAHSVGKQYEYFPANMMYNKLLIDIIQHEPDSTIQKYFAVAKAENKYILPYLTGKKRRPVMIPDASTFGSDDEAIIYATDEYGLDAWHEYPDAVKVLKQLVEEHK